MPELEFELAVGETLRIGDSLVTLVDIDEGPHGGVAFRIESGGSAGVLVGAEADESPLPRMRPRAK